MANERSYYRDRASGAKVTRLTHYRGHREQVAIGPMVADLLG